MADEENKEKADETTEDTVKEEAEAKAEIDIKEPGETAKKEEKSLDRMTSKELREIAVEIPGVTGVHAMKKEQLLEVIKEERGIKDEVPGDEGKRKKARGSIRALKEKIFLLKQEKKAAQNARDGNKVDILRRRINRLKKQTRKVSKA